MRCSRVDAAQPRPRQPGSTRGPHARQDVDALTPMRPAAPAGAPPVPFATRGVPEDPSIASTDAVAADCLTDLVRGLSAAEADRRLARDGANVLRSLPSVPAWRCAMAQLRDPLVMLLLVAAAVALAAWLIEGRAGWPMDAIVITIVVLLNAVLVRRRPPASAWSRSPATIRALRCASLPIWAS